MTASKHILLIIFTLCLTTSIRAQLVFAPAEWDFGTLDEANGRVSHTFTGTNRGDKPQVIFDVVTTCGCTVPAFSRQPILPGEKTQITVTYDPANRPGSFSRDLSVYTSDRKKVAALTIRGTVTPRPKSVEELYPAEAGGGLRLSTTLCAFSYIYIGQTVQSSVGYANTSGRTIFLELRAQDKSGALTVDYPRTLPPGARGEINFAYLISPKKPHYGTLRDVLEVVIDGHATETLLMAHGIGVDTPPAAESRGARADISENILKFGPVKHAGPTQRHTFTLRNTGDSELIVRAVESGGCIATTLTPGIKIPAGGSFAATVTLDPRQQNYGVLSEHLILVTNDPVRPMRRIRVTAIIEE